MALTDSFPLGIEHDALRAQVTRRTSRLEDARAAALAVMAVFFIGSCAAAAGIAYESDGYGGITVAAGGLMGLASALPMWWLLRGSRRS